MTPYFADPRAVLIRGDALDVLRALPDASIDSLCTDPPAGIGFMAKGWDKDKGGRDVWIAWLRDIMIEAYRVLKPGAHGLVWALPRTSHWTATACENAGFEIRDKHYHLFGTGFPKSLDVSKAIDASLGAERTVVGTRPGTGSTTFAGEVGGKGLGPEVAITHPATNAASAWDGWGTALKPAVEEWILVRKPLANTVAKNVLEHGTGALNIDACRINGGERPLREHTGRTGNVYGVGLEGSRAVGETTQGRWPAHVSLDEEAAAMLDEQAGPGHGGHGGGTRTTALGVMNDDGWQPTPSPITRPADKGGASRFFYVAKAPRAEKDLGCEALPTRTGGEATDREEGSAGLSNPRAGAGRTGGARNHHPTVKNIALMRWLVRLITPPGGLVLDCFAGSGSTGVAALHEGFRFVGIERDLDDATGESLGYCEVIKARLVRALADTASGG